MPDLLKRLAALRKPPGNDAEATATLERLNYIYPVKDEELHRHLGDLLFPQKQYDGAIREYNALVASNPVDKAGANSISRRPILPPGRKTRPRKVCWPRSKLRRAIAPHKSCCSSCSNRPQSPTDKKGIAMVSVCRIESGRSAAPTAHRALSRGARGDPASRCAKSSSASRMFSNRSSSPSLSAAIASSPACPARRKR